MLKIWLKISLRRPHGVDIQNLGAKRLMNLKLWHIAKVCMRTLFIILIKIGQPSFQSGPVSRAEALKSY